jgi:hypothetical protein
MPLFGLNLAGLCIGGVWLISEGQMQVIWLAFVMLFFSPFLIPILLIPAGVFSHYMALYGSAGRKDRESLMFFLSLGYIILFLTFWCMGIFEYVTHNVAPHAVSPGVLWACTAAMMPLLWWSRRDAHNFFIMMMVEAAQLVMIALSAERLLNGERPFWHLLGIFGGLLVLVAAMQSIYEKNFMNKAGGDPR